MLTVMFDALALMPRPPSASSEQGIHAGCETGPLRENSCKISDQGFIHRMYKDFLQLEKKRKQDI